MGACLVSSVTTRAGAGGGAKAASPPKRKVTTTSSATSALRRPWPILPTSSRNRNRGNRGNIKSRQRGPSRLRLSFLQPDLSLTRMSDSSCARQRARSSTFIVSESLFPTRSHGEYYLKVPLMVLVESTSRCPTLP